jgi:hypothetical protein
MVLFILIPPVTRGFTHAVRRLKAACVRVVNFKPFNPTEGSDSLWRVAKLLQKKLVEKEVCHWSFIWWKSFHPKE